jgi:hypothetical protein
VHYFNSENVISNLSVYFSIDVSSCVVKKVKKFRVGKAGKKRRCAAFKIITSFI